MTIHKIKQLSCTEIQKLKGALHFSVQHLLLFGRANLIARQAHDLLNNSIDVSKPY